MHVICNGNRSHFGWLLNWCAALVQRPGQHAMAFTDNVWCALSRAVQYSIVRKWSHFQLDLLANAA